MKHARQLHPSELSSPNTMADHSALCDRVTTPELPCPRCEPRLFAFRCARHRSDRP